MAATARLLDTHALIWFGTDDPRLSAAARESIEDPDGEVFVSAATAWEVATKHRIGKLPEAEMLALTFDERIRDYGFTPLPITIQHGLLSGGLVGAHKDPFDRMLIAQALSEKLLLVSNERAFDGFGVNRLW